MNIESVNYQNMYDNIKEDEFGFQTNQKNVVL